MMYQMWCEGVPQGDFASLDAIRAYLQERLNGRKLVERDCGGRWQFILKDPENVGAAGLYALINADVYEVRPSVTIGVPVGGIGVRS